MLERLDTPRMRQTHPSARSLLADLPILMLDEPTSNLDSLSEAVVREAIDGCG
jgi:ATP-binding cassette subfamily B protein/ATP-binding cassette subfamily C protein